MKIIGELEGFILVIVGGTLCEVPFREGENPRWTVRQADVFPPVALSREPAARQFLAAREQSAAQARAAVEAENARQKAEKEFADDVAQKIFRSMGEIWRAPIFH